MPKILDSRLVGNILYKQERQTLSRQTKVSYMSLRATEYTDIYRKMTVVIRNLLPQMKYVLIANIRLHQEKKSLFIDLRSTGSRYCTAIGAEHKSNRVYFVALVRSGKMFLNCYNKECRENLKQSEKKEFQLDPDIRQDLCSALDIPMKSKIAHVNLHTNKAVNALQYLESYS